MPSRPSSDARPSRPLCFQCYRAELDRQRAIGAAGALDTGSAARFQVQLPFEPVNRARLDALKAARAEARSDAKRGVGRYVDKRRQAQIAARHTLQCLADGLKARKLTPAAAAHAMDAAIHAAELQLPDAWLPFVVSGCAVKREEPDERRVCGVRNPRRGTHAGVAHRRRSTRGGWPDAAAGRTSRSRRRSGSAGPVRIPGRRSALDEESHRPRRRR